MVVGDGGITITQFQVLLSLLLVAGGAFAGWLYRHERWFRDRVFPIIQVLTGENSSGSSVHPSENGGVIGETDTRLVELERSVEDAHETQEEIRENVEDLRRTQKRHNRQTEAYLRRITEAVDGVDLSPPEGELYRGPYRDERADESRRER